MAFGTKRVIFRVNSLKFYLSPKFFYMGKDHDFFGHFFTEGGGDKPIAQRTYLRPERPALLIILVVAFIVSWPFQNASKTPIQGGWGA